MEPVAKQLLKPVMLLHVINVTLQFHLYESSVKYFLMWALSSGISLTRRAVSLDLFFDVNHLKSSAEQQPGCLFY